MPPIHDRADDPVPESWRVALARVEGKLDAIITANAALSSAVTDMDRRLRSTETDIAGMRQQLAEIESHEPPRVSWVAIVSAIAAVVAVLLVLGDRIYQSGGTP